MSTHTAKLRWERGGTDFTYEAYSRNHTWQFDNGESVTATASPDYRGDPDHVDPEEAFVASISSCHIAFL